MALDDLASRTFSTEPVGFPGVVHPEVAYALRQEAFRALIPLGQPFDSPAPTDVLGVLWHLGACRRPPWTPLHATTLMVWHPAGTLWGAVMRDAAGQWSQVGMAYEAARWLIERRTGIQQPTELLGRWEYPFSSAHLVGYRTYAAHPRVVHTRILSLLLAMPAMDRTLLALGQQDWPAVEAYAAAWRVPPLAVCERLLLSCIPLAPALQAWVARLRAAAPPTALATLTLPGVPARTLDRHPAVRWQQESDVA